MTPNPVDAALQNLTQRDRNGIRIMSRGRFDPVHSWLFHRVTSDRSQAFSCVGWQCGEVADALQRLGLRCKATTQPRIKAVFQALIDVMLADLQDRRVIE